MRAEPRRPAPFRGDPPERIIAGASMGLAVEVVESLRELGTVVAKRFFGGSGLVLDGVQFAFVMKGSLYLRTDERSRPGFERLGAHPFSYATRRGRITVASYFEAPAEVMEDPEALRAWTLEAYGAALRGRREPAPSFKTTPPKG